MSGIGITPYMPMPERQADVTLSQANPVSTTEYEILPETTFVRLIGIYVETTGGTTSQLRANTDIDGNTVDFTVNNPVSGQSYKARDDIEQSQNQTLHTASQMMSRAFLEEGRTVSVGLVVTWTVQPSPLEGRVKYSKW